MNRYHVAFNVQTTIWRFVDAGDEDIAIEKAAEATDSPEDFYDADWQFEWVHPETERCKTPGVICWDREL